MLILYHLACSSQEIWLVRQLSLSRLNHLVVGIFEVVFYAKFF